MAADLALRRSAATGGRAWVPARWLVAAAVVLAVVGVATTAMLSVVASSSDSPYGRWLEFLLPLGESLPLALLLGLVPAIYHAWANRSRLARRLTLIMLLEVVLASLLILLPFWALNASYEESFERSFDDLATTSSSLSDKIVTLEHKALDVIASEALEVLENTESELAQGLFVDEFRLRHQLDQVVHLDKVGRIRHISPATSRLDDIRLFPFLLASGDAERRTFREVIDSDPMALALIRVESFRSGSSREQGWLWIKQTLPESVSADITTVEESGTAYHKSRSQRSGLIKIFNLVIFNAVTLLLFVAINLSVYVGTRLGKRLGNLSESMAGMASAQNPGSKVPVEGDDEITVVSRAFNEMIARLDETTAKEKQALAELESIQGVIDAGLLVLDSYNRIARHNPAAERLLGTGAIKENESLDDLARRFPDLGRFAKLLGDPATAKGGETKVGEHKLWVKVSAIGETRIVLLTDISEPLALEEIRARQEAISYTLHGIKNPLQPLLYHAESLDRLEKSLSGDDAKFLAQRREALLHNINRINEQIEDMGRLVRKSDLRFVPIDVNDLVRGFASHGRQASSRCILDLDETLVAARFDKHELHEVLENLQANSEQQFAIDGTEDRKTKISTAMEDGMVVLRFEDNAGGIDEGRLDDIFRPHMSQKPKGQGLGLARVKDAVGKAGGSVEAGNFTWDGKAGARFTIRLQAAQVAAKGFS